MKKIYFFVILFSFDLLLGCELFYVDKFINSVFMYVIVIYLDVSYILFYIKYILFELGLFVFEWMIYIVEDLVVGMVYVDYY